MSVEVIDIHDDSVAYEIASLHDTADDRDCPEWPKDPAEIRVKIWRHPDVGELKRHYIVRESGAIAGHMQLRIPQRENLHMLEMDLLVHPDYRRRGIGTALLNAAISYSKQDGRTQILADAAKQWEGGPYRSDAGQKFAVKHGMTPALTEVIRRAPVTYLDAPTQGALLATAKKSADPAYSIESWVGPVPDHHAESLAALVSTIIDEIPLGDIDYEVQSYDVQRLRESEKTTGDRGFDRIVTVAVHRDTDTIVGFTQLVAPAIPAPHANQHITIVDPAHRGHRLGIYIKLENLRQLRREFPHVETIYTGNADTNIQMETVNKKLGFTEFAAEICFKFDLDRTRN